MSGVVEGGVRKMKKSNAGREAGGGNGAGTVGWGAVGDLGRGRPSRERWAPRLGGRTAGGGGPGTSEKTEMRIDTPKRKYPPINHRTKHGYLTHLYIYTVNPPLPAHLPPTASCEAPKATRCASSSRGRRETWWRCDSCTAHPLRRGAHHRRSRRAARSEGGLHACPRQSA